MKGVIGMTDDDTTDTAREHVFLNHLITLPTQGDALKAGGFQDVENQEENNV